MSNHIKFLMLLLLPTTLLAQSGNSKKSQVAPVLSKWLQPYDFKSEAFRNPAQQYLPFARWWWPGNAVTNEELTREINLFADHAFGGMEIQTLNLGLPKLSSQAMDSVLSWDTPSYYEHLKTVLNAARKRNLTIDLTNGSGWPAGGPFLDVEDGFLNLQFAEKDIEGGRRVVMPLPSIENETGVPERLEAVLAVKALPKKADDDTKTAFLESTSTIVLTDKVKQNSLDWLAPAGKWKIIAFWSKPKSKDGSMVAAAKQGPVLNHFDSLKVFKNYNYILGDRTGLPAFYGNPLRAVFTDSYEFGVDRHFAHDLLPYFKERRGYDAAPWLPANMQTAYNYAYWKNPSADPDFSFSDQDWRLRYDYDLTVSELFQRHFVEASKHWLEERGLLFRNQGYGMRLDMIAIAGHASIPETESMMGTEALMKVMASGAHLYNRPLLSAESVVFAKRAYMTTPQKARMAVDKLFAAGVNQIIYHGISYRYITHETMPIGWNPFSAPGINFSSDFGEGNIFWKSQKQLNEYIGRTQYALRAGKPRADVLIYFPLMISEGMPVNPEEIMTHGYIEGVEPPLPNSRVSAATRKATEETGAWISKVYPIINQLEANGITWDWVNDASIQEAQLTKDNKINIRGNIYQALVLANDSIIQLNTATHISQLASNGMPLVASGTLPYMQPSFLNWKENDSKTQTLIAQAIKEKNSRYLQNEEQVSDWIKSLEQPVAFNGQYKFTRQAQREMSDGSRVQFIWNKSNEWQTISLTLDKKYKDSYWFNAEDGSMAKNNGSTVSYRLAPYGSIILYASTVANSVPKKQLVDERFLPGKIQQIVSIDKWDIKADSVTINNSPLFDWKDNEQLKYSSAEGVYTTSFDWKKQKGSDRYWLSLGKVNFTAEVYLNNKKVGGRIFSPYMLDVTDFLQPGINKLEVRVTPGQLNDFIGKALKGDSRFRQFKAKEYQPMSAGLQGPVVIGVVAEPAAK